jgi:hypothetical protein
MAKAQTDWNKYLMEVYEKLKKTNPDIKLKDAMKVASKSYKEKK